MHNILKKNGYPDIVINKLFRNTPQNNTENSKFSEQLPGDELQFFRFPFIDKLSKNIQFVLKKYDIRLAFYPTTKISHIYTNLKSKYDITDISQVIYKIPCMNCDLHYIGTTKNKLGRRLKQHANDCKLTNAQIPNKTALAQHHFQFGHHFNFDSATILDVEPIHRKRYLSEAIHIRHSTHSVNFNTDTQQLSHIYVGLLR